jgi:PAS domain S-box-containing protein
VTSESKATDAPGGHLAWPIREHPVRNGVFTALFVFISSCIPLLYLGNSAQQALEAEVNASLREAAESASLMVDGDLIRIVRSVNQESESAYQSELAKLRRFIAKNPRLIGVGCLVERPGEGVRMVLGVTAADAEIGVPWPNQRALEPVMDPPDTLLRSLRAGVSVAAPEIHRRNGWAWRVAYAPFRDRDGRVTGSVLIALRMEAFLDRMARLDRAVWVGYSLAALLAMALGVGVWSLGRRNQAARREVWQALEARNLAESRYQQLFDQVPIGVVYYGSDMRITHFNRRFSELVHAPGSAMLGFDMNKLGDARFAPTLRRALTGESATYLGAYHDDATHRDAWIEVLAGPVRDASGTVVGGIASFEDITVRHRAEVMSQTEKDLLAMISRSEPLLEVLNRLVLDMEKLMPGSLCSILFLDDEGKRLFNAIAPHLPQEYTRLVDGAAVGSGVGSCGTAVAENRMVISPDIQNDPLWSDYREVAGRFSLRACWSKPIHTSHGGILGTFAIYHDHVYHPAHEEVALLERAGYIAGIAIERSRHGEELARERNLLRTLIENLSDVIFIKDKRHHYLAANAAAARYLGVAGEGALLGRTDFDLFPPATAAVSHHIEQRVLAGSPDINQESTIINENGETTILSFSRMPLKNEFGETIGLVVIGRNVTDQHHIEAERIKAQKLESLGLLAGGIAHDFNNILTSILGNISMIRQSRDGASPENIELITESEQAVLRARELTQQLLTFAKGGLPVKRPADVGRVVADAARFAARGSASRLVLDIPADLWIADIDSGQISQVVQNLVLNADQAMPSGGVITISAANTELKQGNRFSLPTGTYVAISVKDHGVGIPERNLGKIFDPYFSTKSTGNGLGLTTSFSIIKKHGGNLVVQSVVDKGSEFTFLLPGLPGQKLVETEVDGPRASARDARILIMDDEEAILKITARILERAGFQVRVARHGLEALNLYQQAFEHGTPFDLVILDLTIPGGMGGKETFENLQQLDPSVKAIVSSGYSMDEIMARHEMFGFTGVVTKPYHRDDLIAAINRALGEPSPA